MPFGGVFRHRVDECVQGTANLRRIADIDSCYMEVSFRALHTPRAVDAFI